MQDAESSQDEKKHTSFENTFGGDSGEMKKQTQEKPVKINLIRMTFLFVALLCLCACASSGLAPEKTNKPRPEMPTAEATTTPQQEDGMTGNLIAWVDDLAQAEKIAELYDIELVVFSDHIALYNTDRDPSAVIKLGKANGWPELSKNDIITIDDPK